MMALHCIDLSSYIEYATIENNGWDYTDRDTTTDIVCNFGSEGETDDPNVIGLRRRLIKNAFAALLCSRGPAMFFAGDEFCNTQFGNNNAYCQDNIISWLDWGRLEEFKEIHDFVRHYDSVQERASYTQKDDKAFILPVSGNQCAQRYTVQCLNGLQDKAYRHHVCRKK
jgi:Type II secretory pathway, pullulanase PulA and related glycosidases